MPFKSKSQMAGAFSGAFGPSMKAAAPQWAAETSSPKDLPQHAKHKKVSKRETFISAIAAKSAKRNPFAK